MIQYVVLFSCGRANLSKSYCTVFNVQQLTYLSTLLRNCKFRPQSGVAADQTFRQTRDEPLHCLFPFLPTPTICSHSPTSFQLFNMASKRALLPALSALRQCAAPLPTTSLRLRSMTMTTATQRPIFGGTLPVVGVRRYSAPAETKIWSFEDVCWNTATPVPESKQLG